MSPGLNVKVELNILLIKYSIAQLLCRIVHSVTLFYIKASCGALYRYSKLLSQLIFGAVHWQINSIETGALIETEIRRIYC